MNFNPHAQYCTDYEIYENENIENEECEIEVGNLEKGSDEILIDAVRSYPHLYNSSLKEFKDTQMKQNSRREISRMLDLSIEVCQNRWVRLRDRFAREKRLRETETRSGSGASHRSGFPLYNNMLFLEHHVKRRKSYTNVPGPAAKKQLLDISNISSRDIDISTSNISTCQALSNIETNSFPNSSQCETYNFSWTNEVTSDSVPRDSVSRDSVPRDSVSRDSVPRDSVSRDSIPRDSVPRHSVSRDSVSRDSVPRHSVPRDSVPRDSVPRHSVSRDSVPRDSVPRHSVPRDSEPRDSVPRDSEPRDSVPRHSVPRDSEPRDSVPRDSEPRDSVPRDSVPRDSVPRDSVPRHSVSRDSVPRDSVPRDSVPRDSVPRDSVSIDSISIDSSRDSVSRNSTPSPALTNNTNRSISTSRSNKINKSNSYLEQSLTALTDSLQNRIINQLSQQMNWNLHNLTPDKSFGLLVATELERTPEPEKSKRKQAITEILWKPLE